MITLAKPSVTKGRLAAAGGLLIALLAVQSHVRQGAPAKTRVAAAASKAATVETEKAATGIDPMREIQFVGMERAAGLSRIKVKPHKDGVHVPVRLTMQHGCRAGVGDAVRLDQKAGARGALLLTLEPIDPKDTTFAAQKVEVTANDLSKGLTRTFSVPANDGVLQAGIFLCRDANGTGHCAGNHLYWYRYAALEKRMAVIQDVSDPRFAAPLAAYVGARTGDQARGDTVARLVGEYDKGLTHAPASGIRRGALEANLELFDGARCK